MAQLTIRPIQQDDNGELARIIRTAFEEFDAPKTGTVYSDPTTDSLYELFNKKDKSCCLVAVNGDSILGCCGIYHTDGLEKNQVELVKFYLDKEARGKGIGKALFEQCIEKAKGFGYLYLYIESQPSFGKAVKMYEAYGFKYLRSSLGNSGHDNCDVWMLKSL